MTKDFNSAFLIVIKKGTAMVKEHFFILFYFPSPNLNI